jgi:hypothetical protein
MEPIVVPANEQNLERLSAEVLTGQAALKHDGRVEEKGH